MGLWVSALADGKDDDPIPTRKPPKRKKTKPPCPKNSDSSPVSVTSTPSPLKWDNNSFRGDFTSDQLLAIRREHKSPPTTDGRTLGWTTFELINKEKKLVTEPLAKTNKKLAPGVGPTANGAPGVCFILYTVKLDFPGEVVTYLAKEELSSTCKKAIESHEVRHREIINSLQKDATSEILTEVEKLSFPTPNSPWHVSSEQVGVKKAEDMIDRVVNPIRKKIGNKVLMKNTEWERLDYPRVRRACRD